MSTRSAATLFIALACLLVAGPPPAADDPPGASHPLAGFDRLVGGRWYLEGSYQVFEWGVGNRSVRGRSYFVRDGDAVLVSEGFWYWHPGQQKIRGVFTAKDMPVELFDFTTRFEGDRMISDLGAFGADGSATSYVETWEFTDDTHFTWTLYRVTPDGPVKEMGGVYTRSE